MLLFWILTPLCAILAFAFNTVKYGKFGIKSCLFVFISVTWAFVGAGISTYNCVNGFQDLCWKYDYLLMLIKINFFNHFHILKDLFIALNIYIYKFKYKKWNKK